ncbi:MAG TPA: choice-of-anchor tandem repeat NxxGxxAF-containing protein [Tepidisphaeraceae bacterium]|jgi:hypothetical protein
MKKILHNHKIAFATSLFTALPAPGQISIAQISKANITYPWWAKMNDSGQVVYYGGGSQIDLWSNSQTQVVVNEDDPVPGDLPNGHYIFSDHLIGSLAIVPELAINDVGQIAFAADFATHSSTEDGTGNGTWLGQPGAFELVSTLTHGFWGIDSAGFVLGDTPGILLLAPGEKIPVASPGALVPGANNLTFVQISDEPIVTAAGYVGYAASTTSQDTADGIWEYTPAGSTIMLMYAAQQVPQLPTGIVYDASNSQPPTLAAMSASGNVGYSDGLTGSGTTTSNNWAIFADISGSFHALVRFGDPVPNFAPFIFSNHLDAMQINDSGEVALVNDITHPGVNTAPALFRWKQDQISIVAWYGEYAPGFGNGWLLGNFNQMFMNNNGQILFTSDIRSDGGTKSVSLATLWLVGENNQPELILRTGIPTYIDGQWITFQDIDLLALNNNNQALISDPKAGGLYLITLAPEPTLAASLLLLPLYFLKRSRSSAA